MELVDFLADEVKALLGDAPPFLYHYTSASGMISIIESGVLRAGSLHRMNDMAEVRFAASVFRACLDRRCARTDSGGTAEILTAMQDRMREPVAITNIFSASFSSDGDEEGMWQLYASRGTGFSFCIPIGHGLRWSEGPPFGWFWRCHYGEETVTAFCNRALSKAEELFDRITAERKNAPYERVENPDGEGAATTDFANEYLNWIAPFAAAFKPGTWADEQEWRWVFVRHPDDTPAFLELDLRNSRQEDKLAIAAICAGPQCNQESIDRVRSILDSNGLAGCPIHRSLRSPQRVATITNQQF